MIQIKVNNELVETINYSETKIDGFIEVDSIPQPVEKDGFKPIMYYRNGQIVYEYEPLPPMPEPEPTPIPEPSAEELYKKEVIRLIRERYDSDDELAFQRQRESKPDDFKVYNDYCEECKAKAREKYPLN